VHAENAGKALHWHQTAGRPGTIAGHTSPGKRCSFKNKSSRSIHVQSGLWTNT